MYACPDSLLVACWMIVVDVDLLCYGREGNFVLTGISRDTHTFHDSERVQCLVLCINEVYDGISAPINDSLKHYR